MKKGVVFEGDSLERLRAFPSDARQDAGFQLDKVQKGQMPDDFKPLKKVGSGVYEIRVRSEDGAYRVVFVAKFTGYVYVLHAFQKKTQQTSGRDIALAAARYDDVRRRHP